VLLTPGTGVDQSSLFKGGQMLDNQYLDQITAAATLHDEAPSPAINYQSLTAEVKRLKQQAQQFQHRPTTLCTVLPVYKQYLNHHSSPHGAGQWRK